MAKDYKNTNVLTLAFMGDAVYEQFIRRHIIDNTNIIRPDMLHKEAVKHVRASAQAEAVKAMFDQLTEEEQDLVKRARNHKTATKPKNADAVEYKWATAFEALIGYLYLTGQNDRLTEIMEKSL